MNAGKYVFEARDTDGNKGTATVKLEIKQENGLEEVEASTYYNAPVIAISGARIGSEPSITVQWDALSKVYTFTPKTGVTITKLSNGRIKLSTTNPEDQKWEGEYRIYFKKNDHNTFIGFYGIDMSGPCTSSKYTEECKPLCQERWLPEEVYDTEPCKEFDDIQIYGNSEVTNTTLTELGGTSDATAEAFDYKDAHIVPAKCKNGEIIGYHVFYFNFREDKPVLQIGKDKLDEFKNNYDVYKAAGNSYYYQGEPSEGRKKLIAGMYLGSWDVMWDGVKNEWKSCINDPECLASIILSTAQGFLSVIPIKNYKIIGTPDYPHELAQAEALGGLTRATEIEFFGSSTQGIEGVIRNVDNEVLPMSLKKFSGEVKSNFRNIRDNGNSIKKSGDPNVKIGSNPNTYLYAEVSYPYQELKSFIESSASNVLPQKDVFKQVIIKTSDGKLALVPTN